MFPVVRPVFTFAEQPNNAALMWAWLQCDLDVATASAAHAELSGLLDDLDGPTVVLVHFGVDHFVDLRGLRVLVQIAMSLSDRGGEMVVVAPPRCLRLIVNLTGVGAGLSVAATPQRAIEWLNGRTAAHDGLPRPSTSTAEADRTGRVVGDSWW
jgi:anti-anti-sigma factor